MSEKKCYVVNGVSVALYYDLVECLVVYLLNRLVSFRLCDFFKRLAGLCHSLVIDVLDMAKKFEIRASDLKALNKFLR